MVHWSARTPCLVIWLVFRNHRTTASWISGWCHGHRRCHLSGVCIGAGPGPRGPSLVTVVFSRLKFRSPVVGRLSKRRSGDRAEDEHHCERNNLHRRFDLSKGRSGNARCRYESPRISNGNQSARSYPGFSLVEPCAFDLSPHSLMGRLLLQPPASTSKPAFSAELRYHLTK